MATPLPARDIDPITLRFGYGLNTQMTDTVIDPQECADGQNFRLDLNKTEWMPRQPFDLVGTAPGTGSILGYAQLRKRDGSLSTLIQQGTSVYVWDGTASGFTDTTFTVAANTRMRGKPREHVWLLDERVLISDLALQNDVMSWDGSVLQNVAFKKSDGSPFGTLRCKYIYVTGERAHYGNTVTSTSTPHLLAGSKLSEYDVVADTGAATDAADPFFVLTPDLKPINGALGAFGLTVISSENGSLYRVDGADATDFSLQDLYPISAVRGNEAMAYFGNDIVFGLQGRIEVLQQGNAAFQFLSDNLGYHVEHSIENVDSWTVIYNRRRQFAYFFPAGQSACWSLDKKIWNFDKTKSPWSYYTTLHPIAFQPTCVWSMFDPQTALEEVYMGDSSGNIYQLEGSGSGDGGTYDIRISRTSGVFSLPPTAKAWDFEGWLYYRKALIPGEIRVEIQWAGESVYDTSTVIPIPARAGGAFYGGPVYYGGETYYGVSFGGRLNRKQLGIPGSGSDFQIKISAEGKAACCVERLEMRFKAAG